MTDPLRLVGLIAGLVVVLGTATSVFTTLVVPRTSSSRLFRAVLKGVGRVTRSLLRLFPSYEAKDRVMAVVGPLGMVLLFVWWLGLITGGFGLLIWWDSGTTLLHALAISGSSVTTLGVDTTSHHGAEALEFMDAGVGLLVVALEIAYLPTLYQQYSLRETEVTLLASRAGSPAWGPEILARHRWFRTTSELPDLFRTWERWSAAVAESHANYPALMWFRSPVPSRSWLTALVAMMDAAALGDATAPSTTPRQARICLTMGITCLRSLAQALQLPYERDPLPTDPVRLTYEEYLVGTARLEKVGYEFERSPEEAWPHFKGWRVNYESIVDALTHQIMPPPTPWLADRPEAGTATWPTVLNRTPDDPEAHQPLIT